MNYMRGFQFIRDREKWLTNVLLGAVCLLIPVVGQIVFVGYLFDVIEALHKDPEHKNYPDFDFGRFSDYLGRGIWPWLAEFLFGLIIAIPLMIIFMVIMVGAMALSKGEPWGILIAYAFLFLVGVPLSIFLGVVVWGPEFQAGMTRQFQLGPMIDFGKRFFRLMKKEMFVSALVLVGATFVAMILVVVTCYVAAFFVGPVFMYAKHHWLFQMYELYLQRGGTPITSSEPAPTAPTAEPG
ncbi:MAG TPA: DUF4013 domain-containing protein [Gemmataceae bacterium]|nr:DUF4013 domain-containing protein [Gemmataceae bacterium]